MTEYTHKLSMNKLLDAYGIELSMVKSITVKGDLVTVVEELT